MKRLLTLARTARAPLASAGMLYLGAYPNSVLVFDEAKGQIVDRIHLTTGLPMSLRLSQDRKKIYVTTNDHSGIEVIDVATRKVINHFVLDNATQTLSLQRRRSRSRGQSPLHYHHRNHQDGGPLRDRASPSTPSSTWRAEDRQDRGHPRPGRKRQRVRRRRTGAAAVLRSLARRQVSLPVPRCRGHPQCRPISRWSSASTVQARAPRHGEPSDSAAMLDSISEPGQRVSALQLLPTRSCTTASSASAAST